jgi:hypothetical protein
MAAFSDGVFAIAATVFARDLAFIRRADRCSGCFMAGARRRITPLE